MARPAVAARPRPRHLSGSGHRAVRPRARVRGLTWTAVMDSGLSPPDVLTEVKPFMQRKTVEVANILDA